MRKRYLIDKAFQTRFALEMVMFVVVVPFLVWVTALMLGVRLLSPATAAAASEGHGALMLAVFKEQWLPMLLLYAFNMAVVYALIVYHSHRIAGPVYRFVDTLRRVGEGDLTQHIKLRKHDFLKDLGIEINRVTHGQTAAVQELRRAVRALKHANQRANDPHIEKEIDALERLLRHYRIDETDVRAHA